ncbi:MAG: glycosyltransferase [Acidobacteria bacterium]|nr:glycosyltransferase [Acidobacteriota bacterium]
MSGRILWITDRYPPAGGGMSVSCARQVRGLRRRGVAVDVLVLGAANVFEARIEERDGGADILLPAETEPAMSSNQAWILTQTLHARSPYSHAVGFGASTGGFHAVTFAAWLGARSTVLVRGNDLDRDWFWPQRGGMVREALSRATSIGAVTMEKVERIRALYPSARVEWTPNGVDVSRWELLPADRARRDEVRGLLGAVDGVRVIGLFGELKAKKRIPFWLEAVRDLGLMERLRLLVVGTLDAPTAAILDDPAIAPRSVRISFSAPDQLAGLYAAADFVAIPSMFEGMPNVLLEAMACGVVPIVSDAGAMRELITDGVNGFLFASEDRTAAGTATARAITMGGAEYRKMSAAVRDFAVMEFSPERELDVLCGLIGV